MAPAAHGPERRGPRWEWFFLLVLVGLTTMVRRINDMLHMIDTVASREGRYGSPLSVMATAHTNRKKHCIFLGRACSHACMPVCFVRSKGN